MSVVRNIEFTQIAADWDSITLGEKDPQALLVIRNGLTAKQVQDNGEYKVSRIETIRDGWIDDTRVRFVSGLEEKYIEKYLLQKGDILFSHINSDRHLGKTGFADRDYDDLLHGMNLLLIRANQEVYYPEFLNRVFQYYRDIGVFIAICSRAVNQSSINQAKMKALELPLPPLPEQKKIAHILSTVQRAIEAQERIIQTTTELKKALMHKLFTEGLRNEPQKQTEIGPLPESWEVCTVPDSLLRTRVSRKHQIPAKAIAKTGAHPVVDQGQSFVAGFTNDSERLIHFDLPLVIFGDHTRCLKFVDFPFVLGADGTKILKSNPELFDPKFFFYALVALDLPSRGYNRHFKLLKEKSVPRPPIAEQRDIATAIGTAAHKCSDSESKRSALQDLFRTLLHELMTAKTRVHEIELGKEPIA